MRRSLRASALGRQQILLAQTFRDRLNAVNSASCFVVLLEDLDNQGFMDCMSRITRSRFSTVSNENAKYRTLPKVIYEELISSDG